MREQKFAKTFVVATDFELQAGSFFSKPHYLVDLARNTSLLKLQMLGHFIFAFFLLLFFNLALFDYLPISVSILKQLIAPQAFGTPQMGKG